MPYIVERNREALKPEARSYAETSGELTFQFQQIIKEYLKGKGELSYTVISEVLAALSGAKLDFWDRIGRPYEDQKRQENGDVW